MSNEEFKKAVIAKFGPPVLNPTQLAMANVLYAVYDHVEYMPKDVRESVSALMNYLTP